MYLNVHASPVQGGVNSEVDRAGGNARVVVVDEQRVVGDLVPCRPPADNHLIWVDLAVEFVHVLGEVQLHSDLERQIIEVWHIPSFIRYHHHHPFGKAPVVPRPITIFFTSESDGRVLHLPTAKVLILFPKLSFVSTLISMVLGYRAYV